MTRPRRVGLPWYAPEDYDVLRGVLTDGAELPPAYETWRIFTEQVGRVVRDSGVKVVRVSIEPGPFAAWCVCAGPKADARVRYATEAVANMD